MVILFHLVQLEIGSEFLPHSLFIIFLELSFFQFTCPCFSCIWSFELLTLPSCFELEHFGIWTFEYLHISIFQQSHCWPGLVVVAFERPIRSCQQGLCGSRATSPTPLDFPTKMVFAWLSSITVCFLIMILSAQIWAYHILDLIQLKLNLMCPDDPKIENTTKSILSRWSKDYHPWYRGAPPHIQHQLETAKSNFMDISFLYLHFMLWGVFFNWSPLFSNETKKRTTKQPHFFLEKEFVGWLSPWTGSN